MTTTQWSAPETEVMSRVAEGIDHGSVLATIVDVEGSAYRRPGAKMVIDPTGGGVGSISAGCLEDEIRTLAETVIETGESMIETYDLMQDDDIWGLGVGCNGIIDVLLEPLNETYRPVVDAHANGDDIIVITVIESSDELQLGDRAILRESDLAATSGDLPTWLLDAVEDQAADLAKRGNAKTISVETDEGSATVFADGITAPPELTVFGSGHDVRPVVELAARNDFRVTVVGFRGGADLEERFPTADTVYSTSPADLGDAHDFDDTTYTVVMTHNFVDDQLVLEQLLGTEVPYIGLLGPRDRFENILDALGGIDDSDLERIYTPIGLDLGGGTPHQIATSIVAEVLAIHNDRTPRHLKAREGPIHDRPEIGTTN